MAITPFENILTTIQNDFGKDGRQLTRVLKDKLHTRNGHIRLSYDANTKKFTLLNSQNTSRYEIKTVLNLIRWNECGFKLDDQPDSLGNKVIKIFHRKNYRHSVEQAQAPKKRIKFSDLRPPNPVTTYTPAPPALLPPETPSFMQPQALFPVDKALQEFFLTKGFQADEGDTRFHGQFIGECQGSRETRIAAKKISQAFTEVMQPSNLRKNRHFNIQTYLIIVFKRIAHAFTIEGKIDIFGKEVLLEGFCEAFTVPMLAASFRESFAGKETPFDVEQITSQFLATTFSDTTSNEDIEKFVATLKSPDFKGPLCIGSGTDWHYTKVIFYKNFAFNLNRGRNISIYQIDRSVLTIENIRKLVKRYENLRPQSTDIDPGKELLSKFQLLVCFSMKSMKAPNCTYVNSKAGLLALMMIDVYEKNGFGETPQLVFNGWNKAFNGVRPFYKNFTQYDRSKLGMEFIKDFNSWKIIQYPGEQQKKIIVYYKDMLKRLHDKMQRSANKFSPELLQKFKEMLTN